MRVLAFLLRKEFLQIFRDPVIVRLLFVVPLAQLMLLANAATFEVKRARLYVVDHDHSSLSRGVVQRLTGSGRFVLAGASSAATLADAAMLAGDVDAILVVPAAFERDVVRGRGAALQLILDAEDGAAAGVTQTYAARILGDYAIDIGARGRLRSPGSATAAGPGPPRLNVRQRGWYNAELEYRDFMVPAILVVLVTVVGTLLTALNIVREKEAGTLEQLNVTPVRKSTFIAAKLIPLWSLALLVLAIGLLVGRVLFDVPMRGSILLVFLAASIYLTCALGIGLWISAVAETQQQAMFVTFSVVMVYLLMSGVFTPVAAMPTWAQWLAEASPVRHFAVLMRAVLLKGAGVLDVARELTILTVMGATVLTLAVSRYHKRA